MIATVAPAEEPPVVIDNMSIDVPYPNLGTGIDNAGYAKLYVEILALEYKFAAGKGSAPIRPEPVPVALDQATVKAKSTLFPTFV